LGLLGLHRDDGFTRREERRRQVDGQHLVPIVERHLIDRFVRGDAGVVHQHVEATVRRDGGCDERNDVRLALHVGRHRQRAAAGIPDLPGDPFQFVRAPRREHHVCALAPEGGRYPGADSAARARDDRHPAGQCFCHAGRIDNGVARPRRLVYADVYT
jgi:hypothetical protein